MTHADTRSLEEIARKIAALEAMTQEGSNATQGEIENATALIQRLLTKHNLSLEQARKLSSADPKRQTETVIEIQMTPNHSERRFEWEETLAHNIARGFFCKVIYFKLGYYFIGTKTDAMIAIQTFNRLRPMIAQMATRATAAYADEWTAKGVMDTRQLRGSYSLKSFKLSYLNGVVCGIGRKLKDQRLADEMEAITEATGDVAALVVVRDAAIDETIAKKWPKLGKARASDSLHNPEAYDQGRVDGYNINLHKGEIADKSKR